MEQQNPTIGRIVHYTLTQDDVDKINRRRTSSASISERIEAGQWPLGAQAHIGNTVRAGQVCAAVVTAVFSQGNVNLQVLLDGNDTFWATTCGPALADVVAQQGCWSWPPRA